MTRLNLIHPNELTDQHLFSEWREIKMVPKSLVRSLEARGQAGVLRMVPATFRLNTGHVSFFYDKGAYLRKRYAELTQALEERGVHDFNRLALLDDACVFDALPDQFHKDYEPTPEAVAEIRERIALRISERPGWYRMRGVILQ